MGESSVVRLISVADIPKPSSVEIGDLSWIHHDPHLIVHDDGTVVLDNDWWLNEEAGTTFSPDVVDHLRRNPRRPITMAAMRARRSAAWRTIPTTVLLGRTDQLVTDEERRWATDHLDDVRFLVTDQRRRHRSTQPEPGSPTVKLTSRRHPFVTRSGPRRPCPVTQVVPTNATICVSGVYLANGVSGVIG
jgi:hypothetical protein